LPGLARDGEYLVGEGRSAPCRRSVRPLIEHMFLHDSDGCVESRGGRARCALLTGTCGYAHRERLRHPGACGRHVSPPAPSLPSGLTCWRAWRQSSASAVIGLPLMTGAESSTEASPRSALRVQPEGALLWSFRSLPAGGNCEPNVRKEFRREPHAGRDLTVQPFTEQAGDRAGSGRPAVRGVSRRLDASRLRN